MISSEIFSDPTQAGEKMLLLNMYLAAVRNTEAASIPWNCLRKVDTYPNISALWIEYSKEGRSLYNKSGSKSSNVYGDVISNVNYGNKEHFRRIAVDVVLGRMLMERKQYLIERLGYTEESLADLPIMLDAEPSGRGRRKYTRLSRETARKVNRQLLTAAQIPEDIISLLEGEDRMKIDLNAERNDLFASNFRHKAYHICGFTNGELSHHLGNKGVDVYTNHYCDFGNDMLQYAMVCKLYRWTHVYDTKCQTKGIHTLSETINCGRVYTTGCYRDGLAHTELSLEPEQGSEEIIQLEIECEHGLEGAVLTIGKGGEQP